MVLQPVQGQADGAVHEQRGTDQEGNRRDVQQRDGEAVEQPAEERERRLHGDPDEGRGGVRARDREGGAVPTGEAVRRCGEGAGHVRGESGAAERNLRDQGASVVRKEGGKEEWRRQM